MPSLVTVNNKLLSLGWAASAVGGHDGCPYCIAPMVAAKPARLRLSSAGRSLRDRWHRRAACVALIRGTRGEEFFRENHEAGRFATRPTKTRCPEGLGMAAARNREADGKRTVAYLMKIRGRASRLVCDRV